MASDIKWIKITTDMFEDEKIDFISTLPEADAIIVIWIRLLALAGKCNAGGYVLLTEKIPYTEEMLAHKFKKPISVVRLALETFRRLEMLEMENNIMFLPNWEKHQNVEAMEKVREYERLRKAKQRDKKKTLELELPDAIVPDNVPDMSHKIVPDGPGNVRSIDKELITTTTTYDGTVNEAYTKVFGPLIMSSLFQESALKYYKRGFTEVFVREVLYEMGETCKNPSIRLFESIADRWIVDGIYTRAENKLRKQGQQFQKGQASYKNPNEREAETQQRLAEERKTQGKIHYLPEWEVAVSGE